MKLVDIDVFKALVVEVIPDMEMSMKKVGEMLDKLPEVKQKELKHGKWEFSTDTEAASFICSECDQELTTYGEGWQQLNYCPFCGARMDKE